jgi:arylsulfatase A-like enzyme
MRALDEPVGIVACNVFGDDKNRRTGMRWRPWIAPAFVCGLVLLAGCGPSEPRPVNVLFVVVDTLRHDHLGLHGSPRNTSPSIDRFAEDAVSFTHAYSPAPWTQPAVASILTGLYPGSHGLTSIARLPAEALTLTEILGQRGYVTGGVVSHVLLGERFNFDQGFDYFHTTEAPNPHSAVSTDEVTRQAEQALEWFSEAERPFFLFVHYFDPHYNYVRHPEVGFAAPSAGRLNGTEDIEDLRAMELSADEVQFIRDLYDEEIRHTDDGVGRLLDSLRRHGVYDETLVVVTADHGEEFLERGWLGHTRSLYEELTRVPLVVRFPGDSGGARVVDAPVSLVSLTPTVLDVLGMSDALAGAQERSLRPLPIEEPADADGVLLEVDFIPIWEGDEHRLTRKKALVASRHKIIRDDVSGTVELYDLVTDPGERHDLSDERCDLRERLLAALERRVALSRESAIGLEPVPHTEEQFEELRSLGYVGR